MVANSVSVPTFVADLELNAANFLKMVNVAQ